MGMMRHVNLLRELGYIKYPTKRIEDLAEGREFSSAKELSEFIIAQRKLDRVADALPVDIRKAGVDSRNGVAKEMLDKVEV